MRAHLIQRTGPAKRRGTLAQRFAVLAEHEIRPRRASPDRPALWPSASRSPPGRRRHRSHAHRRSRASPAIAGRWSSRQGRAAISAKSRILSAPGSPMAGKRLNKARALATGSARRLRSSCPWQSSRTIPAMRRQRSTRSSGRMPPADASDIKTSSSAAAMRAASKPIPLAEHIEQSATALVIDQIADILPQDELERIDRMGRRPWMAAKHRHRFDQVGLWTLPIAAPAAAPQRLTITCGARRERRRIRRCQFAPFVAPRLLDAGPCPISTMPSFSSPAPPPGSAPRPPRASPPTARASSSSPISTRIACATSLSRCPASGRC